MYNSIRQCKKKKKNQTFEFIKEAWKILSDKRIIYTMDRIARSLRFVSMQCPGRGRSRNEKRKLPFRGSRYHRDTCRYKKTIGGYPQRLDNWKSGGARFPLIPVVDQLFPSPRWINSPLFSLLCWLESRFVIDAISKLIFFLWLILYFFFFFFCEHFRRVV